MAVFLIDGKREIQDLPMKELKTGKYLRAFEGASKLPMIMAIVGDILIKSKDRVSE